MERSRRATRTGAPRDGREALAGPREREKTRTPASSQPTAARGRPAWIQQLPRLQRSLRAWYGRTGRDLPWRRSRDPYAVWISEVMLQQTTVAAVVPYYERFLARYPDLGSLARSGEEDLLALWSGLGYYRRARNLRAAARIVVERHAGRFPSRLEEIRALPGIGRYTAGAIASICFGARTPAVDVNAARVLARLFALGAAPAAETRRIAPVAARASSRDSARISDTRLGLVQGQAYSTPGSTSQAGQARDAISAQLWRIAEDLVPADAPGDWTQALMELGARVCRPMAPDCPRCPVARDCAALAGGNPAAYASTRSRRPSVAVRAALVAITRGGKILLVRRDSRETLGGLWELPGTLASALASSGAAISRNYAGADAEAGAAGSGAASKVSTRRLGSSRPADPAHTRGHALVAEHGMRPGTEPDSRTPRGAAASSGGSARALGRLMEASLGFAPVALELVGTIRHAVTHRRLTIEAWRGEVPAEPSSPGRLGNPALRPSASRRVQRRSAEIASNLRHSRGEGHLWIDPAELATVPLGAASRKVLAAILGKRAAARESTVTLGKPTASLAKPAAALGEKPAAELGKPTDARAGARAAALRMRPSVLGAPPSTPGKRAIHGKPRQR